ncbi:HD domain-containing phosphohydrolase [Deinococcus navajonensis]|uniref:HD domain-containing phosphohydrolase n=1 Tax=Deinococcus navajonensis TaxID=309884 RepID=A0ABV8XSF9_9DEIO
MHEPDPTDPHADDLAQENAQELRRLLALERSRHRQVLADAQIILWELQLDLLHISVDGTGADLGLHMEALPDRFEDWAALVHHADRDATLAALQSAIREARTFRNDHRVVTPSGEVAWLRLQGRPEVDKQGRPCRYVGTAQNITAQKHTARELLDQQARMQAVLAHLPGSGRLEGLQAPSEPGNRSTAGFVPRSPARLAGRTDREVVNQQPPLELQTPNSPEQGTEEALTAELEAPEGARIFLPTSQRTLIHHDMSGHLHPNRQPEHQASRILDSLASAVIVVDRRWVITYLNPYAEQLLGMPRRSLLGQNAWERFPCVADTPLQGRLREALTHPERFELQAPGTRNWFEVTAAPTGDGLTISFVDITGRRELEETLRHVNEDLERRVGERTAQLQALAYQDALTGLPNRRAFEEAFEGAVAHGTPLQLLLFDLDHLKRLNDQGGHDQGDLLLRAFARVLGQTFGAVGSVYRLGGDEFTVLVSGSAADLGAGIREVHEQLGAQGFAGIRASVGVVHFPTDARSSSELLRLADQRMLRDKASVRARQALGGGHAPPAETHLSADMMWQAVNATSALLSSDSTVDLDAWQYFLQVAVAALPGAEAGSLYVLEDDLYVMYAQVGYSDALLGIGHSVASMRAWYGQEGWETGTARVLRDAGEILRRSYDTSDLPEQDPGRQVFEEFGELTRIRSTIAVPVVVAGRVMAVLNIDNLRTSEAFENHEVRTAEEFARQASAILATHERRLGELARTQELEVLAHANAALGFVQDAEEIESILVQETRALLRTEHAAYARYEPEADTLRLVSRSGTYIDFALTTIPKDQGVTWEALNTGQVVHVRRTHEDRRVYRRREVLDGTLLVAPLITGAGLRLGVVVTMRPAPQVFSDLDGRVLGALAHAGVAAFERLHASCEERRRTAELRMLAELSQRVGPADDAATVVRECLPTCRVFLDADLVLFIRPDQSLTVTDGVFPEAFRKAAETLTPAQTARLVESLLENGSFRATHQYAAVPGAHPLFVQAGVQAIVTVPVQMHGRPVALAALLWFRPISALPESAVPLMMRSAELIGNVLERDAYINDIEATREGALLALGLALELRDFETHGHTERVVRCAVAIGRRLGLTDQQLEALRVGAYLHDIGKLAVPDAILLKSGPLNADEWVTMQAHAAVGDSLVSRIPTLPEGARGVVRHHHERWDGTGYPDRLAGHAIPIGARVFSVADVFDALTSERPYKRAWSVEAALAEVQAQAGRQFDPDVVRVALAVLAEQGGPQHPTGQSVDRPHGNS